MTEQISRLDWERFALGELPAEDAHILEERLRRDPQLGREVEEIERTTREDLARYPASRVVPQIRERYDRENVEAGRRFRLSPIWKRIFVLAPALTAAVILAVVVLPGKKTGHLSLPSEALRDDELVKGTAGVDLSKTQLLVYRLRDRKVEELTDGTSGRSGDVLQLAYVSTDKFGVILSLDGAGTISLQFPEQEGAGAVLEPGRKILLPQAIELDAAPLFERIFFVTSQTSFDIRTVLQAAEALARNPGKAERDILALPSGLKQTSFLVRK